MVIGRNQTISQRTKYFGRPSAVYVAKDQIPQPALDAEDNILSDETCILSRWRECFEDLLNPVKVNDLDTHEVIQLGEIETLTAAEVETAIKRERLLGKMLIDQRCLNH